MHIREIYLYYVFFSNLPFGIYSLHPSFSSQKATIEKNENKLHSVSQRFSYQDPDYTSSGHSSKKSEGKAKTQSRQKMTVRLRPRKVLCSNCKGICNENNENVDAIRKRKLEPNDNDDDNTLDNLSSNVEKKYLMGSSLIPKLSRLHPNDITNAIKGNSIAKSLDSCKEMKSNVSSEQSENVDRITEEVAFVDVSENFEKIVDYNVKIDKIESTTKDQNEGAFTTVFSSAKTLKISFGEGEGTVVKIPAIVGDYNEDSGVSCDMSKPIKQMHSKAAKKALKKAKKHAKKNVDTLKDLQLPKHVGALSPHNNASTNAPSVYSFEKKHKPKMKHKRKNKVPKTVRDENTSKSVDSEINYFGDIKQHCLKQKLSISLRRLSSNSYERCSEQEAYNSDSDSWESDVVPEFPEAATGGVGSKPLRVSPGDIVWGKVVGFPWWPGRVLSVTQSLHAHVAWYASTTSSLMPCDSLRPFLEDYKV